MVNRLLVLCLLATVGCGGSSDVKTTDLMTGDDKTMTFDPQAFLNDLKARCIDDRLPLVENAYQHCLIAPGVFGVDGCALDADKKILNLQQAWEEIQIAGSAMFGECQSDPRTQLFAEWCINEYVFNMTFLTNMKCAGAVI